jgi:hypothetical protein
VENITHNARLTAPEIANLWTQYMNDSMASCVIGFYLEKVKDEDVRAILEFALDLSQTQIEKIKEFFNQENYPIPYGFTKDDISLNAPPLFSDTMMLVYMYVMTLHGLTGYAVSVGTSIRADQRKYYIQCNTDTMELYNRVLDTMLHKGIFSRPPYINAPHDVDFVKNQNFLTATQYTRLITEMGQYAEDGVNLLIDNGWMEQPPTTDDRTALANQK